MNTHTQETSAQERSCATCAHEHGAECIAEAGFACGDEHLMWEPRATGAAPAPALAPTHTGMRVDYSGMLQQARRGLRRSPGVAEMLRQFEDHLTEMGARFYAGDTAVVDEFLQLYCIGREARAALAAAPAAQQPAAEAGHA